MSGVLARMARRALGVLPTAEPLKPPRFAPDSLSVREASPGPDLQLDLETFFQTEAAAPRRVTVPASRDQTAPNRSPPEAERRDAATQLRPRATTPTRNDFLEPELREPDRPTRLRAITPAIAVKAAGVLEESSKSTHTLEEDSKPMDALEERSKSAGADVTPRLSARIAAEDRRPSYRIEPSDFADTRETAPARRHSALAALAEQGTNEPATRTMRRNDPRDGASREGSHEPAATPTLAETKRVVPTPVEPRSEIHISIGAIELRAPREAPVSAAPPFRPRVTLEDFLRRKPGASG